DLARAGHGGLCAGQPDRGRRGAPHAWAAPVSTGLPSLRELGEDLLTTTPRQRRIALVRPYVGVVVFTVVAARGWWWVTPLIVLGIFVGVAPAPHDVVPRTLVLRARQTDIWLSLSGLVLLESGHAYQMTHRQHHRLFPSPEDPEGYPAELSLLGAVCYGPVFLVRLWFWSYGRAGPLPPASFLAH